MKTSLFPFLLLGALLFALPALLFAQNTTPADPQAEMIESEPECGGYEPTAAMHLTTIVEGLRLRRRPSKDAPVLATLSKNTRLVWNGADTDEIFEATFDDGVPRKGKWVHVTVWKGHGQSGWVFSGALTVMHLQYDAEFGGGLECLNSCKVNIKRIDSPEFMRRFAQSSMKRETFGNSPLQSPDGRFNLRKLNAQQDKMAGLEFGLKQLDGTTQKITVEMVYGNHIVSVAWAKESGIILIKWKDDELGMMYYEMEVPQAGLRC